MLSTVCLSVCLSVRVCRDRVRSGHQQSRSCVCDAAPPDSTSGLETGMIETIDPTERDMEKNSMRGYDVPSARIHRSPKSTRIQFSPSLSFLLSLFPSLSLFCLIQSTVGSQVFRVLRAVPNQTDPSGIPDTTLDQFLKD